jgi:hypothetical protein
MLKPGRGCAFQLWHNSLCEGFPQLDAPLIEGIDVPDHPLGKNTVFVESNESTQHSGRKPLRQYGVRGPVPLKHTMRYQPIRRALSLDFLRRFAKGKGFGLREHIGHQQVMMPAQSGQWLSERDEIARNEPRALMNELVERVLAVGAGFPPKDRAGIIGDPLAFAGDTLAVALHRQLLKVRREPLQVLLVRQNRYGLGVEKVGVPYTSSAMSTGKFFSNAAVRKCSSIR